VKPNQPLHFSPQDESLILHIFPHFACRYAMERTSTFIKIWFWPRHVSDVPSDVRNSNSDSINTDAWGTPTGYFPSTQCDINSKFTPSNIIVNLTFCESLLILIRHIATESQWYSGGDWAGAVYGSSGCPGTCEGMLRRWLCGWIKWQTSVADSEKNTDYVNNNPGAFSNAYFEFNSVRVYQ